MDLRAPVCGTSSKRQSPKPDSAYAARRWPVRQAFRSESTAMTLIRLHRLLAGCRRRLSVGGQVQGTPTTGRQGKSAASGRAQWLVGLDVLRPADVATGWRFKSKDERFQRSERRRPLYAADLHVMNRPRRGLPPPARTRSRRQAGNPAPEDLCRRGDARCKESRTHRHELQARRGGREPLAIWPGPARSALAVAEVNLAAGRDEGTRGPS